jgi:hypothetical protein
MYISSDFLWQISIENISFHEVISQFFYDIL